jgi:hypothetical protein
VPFKLPSGLSRCGPDDVTVANMAHVSRKPRQFARGVWEPKFTIPAEVDWKIR